MRGAPDHYLLIAEAVSFAPLMPTKIMQGVHAS